MKSNHDPRLIEILLDEIKYLREENENKNCIVKTLAENQKQINREDQKISSQEKIFNLSDKKNNSQFPRVHNEFIYPKRPIKRHETKDKIIKNFLSPNRFEKLIDNDDSVDDLEDNDDLFEINCVNKNRSDKLPLKRPTVVCNNHPENQDVINKSHKNEKSTGKNIKIIGDSIYHEAKNV